MSLSSTERDVAQHALVHYRAQSMSSTSRVTRQNQISVPAEVRRKLAIRPGTVLEWHVVGNELVVRPRRVTLSTLRSEVRRMIGARRASLSELKKGKLAAVRARHSRAVR
jgi:AbrB family looped-hinge helix DNA binding protein